MRRDAAVMTDAASQISRKNVDSDLFDLIRRSISLMFDLRRAFFTTDNFSCRIFILTARHIFTAEKNNKKCCESRKVTLFICR